MKKTRIDRHIPPVIVQSSLQPTLHETAIHCCHSGARFASLLALIVGMGALGWFFFKPQHPPEMTRIPDEAFAALKKSREATQGGNTGVSIDQGSLSTSMSVVSSSTFSIQNATNTSIDISSSAHDGQSSTSVSLTLFHEDPSILSKAAYEKLKPGMKYAEVAGILGGELAKGSMAEGFTGSFTVKNGKRTVVLNFHNAAVESKSATGLD
jgi:hypothetical protein